MGGKKIGSVLVTKHESLWNFYGEDLVSKVLLKGSLDDVVGKYTSSQLITVSPDYSLSNRKR